jgi:hypothetical protein
MADQWASFKATYNPTLTNNNTDWTEKKSKSHVIGSRYMADQWASFKATYNPSPAAAAAASAASGGEPGAAHAVALQVAFESQTLKPVFSLDRL